MKRKPKNKPDNRAVGINTPTQSVPFLEQTTGAGIGNVFEMSRDQLSIGRTSANEIVLESGNVSRVHALIKKTPDGWYIEDNLSKNGTWINGITVKKALLRNADIVQIGEYVFKFYEPVAVKNADLKVVKKPEQQSEETKHFTTVPVKKNKLDWIAVEDAWFMVLGAAAGIVAGALLYFLGLGSKPKNMIPFRQEEIVDLNEPTKEMPKMRSKPAAKVVNRAPVVKKPVPKPPPAPESTIKTQDLAFKGKQKKGVNTEKDLEVYLSEGQNYLRENDRASAELAFRFALVMDPKNTIAREGLAVALGQMEKRPEDKKSEDRKSEDKKPADKKAKVNELIQSAKKAHKARRYQEAIELAQQARKIEIPRETAYLNEAKQIIDQSEQRQKEEFYPFIEEAKKKMSEGDYRGSILLCEEMLRIDPGYAPALECMEKSTAGLTRRGAK